MTPVYPKLAFDREELEAARAEALLRTRGYRLLAPFTGGKAVYAHETVYDAPEAIACGLMVDTETTGNDPRVDQAIQLAIVPFYYAVDSGAVLTVERAYAALEEPTRAIAAEATAVHGLSIEDVRNERFDDERVAALFARASLVLAHNAAFDMPILARRFPTIIATQGAPVWGCTWQDIDWKARGYDSAKLGALLQGHTGYHFAGHDAADDCYAAVHVIAQPFADGTTPLAELRRTLARSRVRVFAVGAAFEAKDKLSARGYRWNDPSKPGAPFPNDAKAWVRELADDELEAERGRLDTDVYRFIGGSLRALVDTIDPATRFLRG